MPVRKHLHVIERATFSREDDCKLQLLKKEACLGRPRTFVKSTLFWGVLVQKLKQVRITLPQLGHGELGHGGGVVVEENFGGDIIWGPE